MAQVIRFLQIVAEKEEDIISFIDEKLLSGDASTVLGADNLIAPALETVVTFSGTGVSDVMVDGPRRIQEGANAIYKALVAFKGTIA